MNPVYNNYADLLLSEEWKSFRLTILNRDGYCCVNCSNRKLKEKYKTIERNLDYFEKVTNKLYWLADINLDENFVVDKNIFLNHIKDKKDIKFLIDTSKKIKTKFKTVWVITSSHLISIYKTVNGADVFLHSYELHVHHKYYQRGLLPWQYPTTALITLCMDCHNDLHANVKVPFLDERGNQISQLTPCYRCNGVGHFQEYHYVEGGICFRCSGAKYEELINK
jgi:hypothetical protein